MAAAWCTGSSAASWWLQSPGGSPTVWIRPRLVFGFVPRRPVWCSAGVKPAKGCSSGGECRFQMAKDPIKPWVPFQMSDIALQEDACGPSPRILHSGGVLLCLS